MSGCLSCLFLFQCRLLKLHNLLLHKLREARKIKDDTSFSCSEFFTLCTYRRKGEKESMPKNPHWISSRVVPIVLKLQSRTT